MITKDGILNANEPVKKVGPQRDFYDENMKYLENKFVVNSKMRAEQEEKEKEIYTFQPNVHRQKTQSSRIESQPSLNYKNIQEHKKYVEFKLKEKYLEQEEDYTFKPVINKKFLIQ